MALISVVLPVYNVQKYLKKCTESIIKQTHEELEIICVDDGSTDGSGKLLDDIAATDARFRVIHQANAGTMQVRSRAIAEAKGEYIAFIDSDDYVASDMLQKLLKAIETNGADIAVGGFEIVDEDGIPLSAVAPKLPCMNSDEALKALILEDYRSTGLYPLWNKLYKKSLFERYKPSPHINTLGEDQYMNMVFIKSASRICYCEDSLYSYVQRTDSVMKAPKLVHVDDFFGLWREKRAFLSEMTLSKNEQKRLFESYFTALFDFYGLCYMRGKDTLIPRFNELLQRDEYFGLANLPKSPRFLLRYLSFLSRRYF